MEKSPLRPRLLIAEDDEDARLALGTLLCPQYEICLEECVEGALRSYREERPDLLVVDYALPDATGVQLLQRIQQRCAEAVAPAIMISAYRDQRLRSRRAGFEAFLEKPYRTLDLIWAIERALARSN